MQVLDYAIVASNTYNPNAPLTALYDTYDKKRIRMNFLTEVFTRRENIIRMAKTDKSDTYANTYAESIRTLNSAIANAELLYNK